MDSVEFQSLHQREAGRALHGTPMPLVWRLGKD